CAIPVFEGLLPEPHNKRVLKLLFLMGHWHGLAKLHLHTDATLAILDSVTASLGQALHEFEMKTCSMFTTCELKKEESTRKCKQATQKKTSQVKKTPPTQELGAGNGDRAVVAKDNVAKLSKGLKEFNMSTYKYHTLGDVAYMIREYGTIELYSMELVSTAHDFIFSFVVHFLVTGSLLALVFLHLLLIIV
ncbi:hypothetical protein L208DRAFT_1301810, partial [Tricholoma matsutake]